MSDKKINYAADRKYAASHEWVKMEGDLAVIGVSDYAQDQLGDVVFVELPAVGGSVEAGKMFGVVESVKAASDLYLPVAGTVIGTNAALDSAPETLNTAPYEGAWMLKIKPANAADVDAMLDAAAYTKLLG